MMTRVPSAFQGAIGAGALTVQGINMCLRVCVCVCVCVYTLSGGMMSNTSDWSLNPLLIFPAVGYCRRRTPMLRAQAPEVLSLSRLSLLSLSLSLSHLSLSLSPLSPLSLSPLSLSLYMKRCNKQTNKKTKTKKIKKCV